MRYTELRYIGQAPNLPYITLLYYCILGRLDIGIVPILEVPTRQRHYRHLEVDENIR